jgi:outer membrane protein OmpA-like peptidoglycan-associated protein
MDTVDIAARKSISASVKAEALAMERKAAREQRNERTRNDAEIRAAENKYSDAQGQVGELRKELDRETRSRELAEREAQTYSTQLREMRDENGRLRDELARVRLDAETANAKLTAIENEKRAAQEAQDNLNKAAEAKAGEATLISSLKAYGSVVKNDRGIVLTLPENLWAGTRSTDLVPNADGKLNNLAQLLAQHPEYRITVEAHTDNSGSPDVVQTVTERRSYTLADKFTTLGVQEGRIVAKGFGASVPVAPNTTNGNRAKNRRMQIVLSPSGVE